MDAERLKASVALIAAYDPTMLVRHFAEGEARPLVERLDAVVRDLDAGSARACALPEATITARGDATGIGGIAEVFAVAITKWPTDWRSRVRVRYATEGEDLPHVVLQDVGEYRGETDRAMLMRFGRGF